MQPVATFHLKKLFVHHSHNIHPGMSTLHPCGFTHGPHPVAFATATQFSRKETDEVAVMVDTRDALENGHGIDSIEWTEYTKSWKGIEKP
jgi:homogentisate 1,2-dioxygenase